MKEVAFLIVVSMKDEDIIDFSKTNKLTFELKDVAAKYGQVVSAEREDKLVNY